LGQKPANIMMSQEEWEESPHHQHPRQVSTVANPNSWVKQLKRTVLQHWQPNPLPVPLVDRDLPRLSGIERAAEVLRFMLQQMEYALSPQGHLREFIKFNLRLAMGIGLPVFLVAPLVTLALNQLTVWTALLTQTMSSFVLFPLSVLLCIFLVCGLLYIGRFFMEMRFRGQQRDRYY
jgi:hypothetical protein